MKGSIADLTHFAFALEGYKVSDEAEKTGDSDVKYYGYLNRFGEFYIMERNTSAGTYRFYTGTAGTYATAFAARESLEYVLFNECFGES